MSRRRTTPRFRLLLAATLAAFAGCATPSTGGSGAPLDGAAPADLARPHPSDLGGGAADLAPPASDAAPVSDDAAPASDDAAPPAADATSIVADAIAFADLTGPASGDATIGGKPDLATTPPDLLRLPDLTNAPPDLARLPDLASLPDLAPAPPDLTAAPPDLAQPTHLPTGAPCTSSSQCAGASPLCVTTDGQGHTYPGGYCTSRCNPFNDDPQTGLDSECPGGAGTCSGSGFQGSCYTACTAQQGSMPCTRSGYACFVEGCLPTSLSDCDPRVKGSCNQPGKACVPVGPNPVGQCVDACDPFAQNCPPSPNGLTQGCYATSQFGEGICAEPDGGGVGSGSPCTYLNSCKPGLSCHNEFPFALCRPYCGGPPARACTNGKSCKDLSSTVKKTVVGVCGN